MINRKIKAAIFDLDGTLADTIYSIRDAINMMLKELGALPRDYEQIREAVGNGAVLLVKRSLPDIMASDDAMLKNACDIYDRMYAKTYTRVSKPYDGIYGAVRALHDSGIKLGVLSNKPQEYTKELINNILFKNGEFDEKAVFGQGKLPMKPEPTATRIICDILGVAPENTVMVGDSTVDVKTAKNAGMLSVAVSWGYSSVEELKNEGADIIINSPHELVTLLRI